MIVELCGPPGVGKTTLAQKLTTLLRDRGAAVELASSYRPAERSAAGDATPLARHRRTDPIRRLIRPAGEILSSAHELLGDSREAVTAKGLMRLLPPRGILWSFRLRQYIRRFSHVWFQARDQHDRIVIFDQAFMQVICSLMLLTARADDLRIMQALDLVPKPDLLVRVDAPREVLEARLVERERRQGRIDSLLEFDLNTNLRSIEVLNHLLGLLRGRGGSSITVQCTDKRTLDRALERLERALMQRSATCIPAA